MKEKIMKLVEDVIEDKKSEVELNDMALTIFKDKVTQRWTVGEIRINGTEKVVGSLKIIDVTTERAVAMERFKMLAGEYFMSN